MSEISKFRLEPKDELPHAPDASPTFNESFYVNGWDPKARLGGWMRCASICPMGESPVSSLGRRFRRMIASLRVG